jgi:transposase
LCFFLWARGLSAKDVHKEKFPLPSGTCLSHKAVHNWVEKFSKGHSKYADDAQPGRPVEIVTEATLQWVEELIQADRRTTIHSVVTALGCSHGLAYSIMHGPLKFQESVHTVGAQSAEGSRKYETNGSVLATYCTVMAVFVRITDHATQYFTLFIADYTVGTTIALLQTVLSLTALTIHPSR